IKKPAQIVPLTIGNLLSSTQGPEEFLPAPESRPWASFRTLVDFEYTETAETVNKQLAGIDGGWAVRSKLTIQNYNDMQESLSRARLYVVQLLTATEKGENFTFKFQYRCPWEKIEDPTDPSDCGPAESSELSQFKREVYQKILSCIFWSLRRRSRKGESHSATMLRPASFTCDRKREKKRLISVLASLPLPLFHVQNAWYRNPNFTK
ncbi:hypothetical protein CVT26_015132, partial [Gymnopilus dilepis]